MSRLSRRFETLMSAVTFAEANEHRAALEILREGDKRTAATQRPVRPTFPSGVGAPAEEGR